jgi:hypothetical protein
MMYLLSVIILVFVVHCNEEYRDIQYPPDTSDQITITQGVWGNVWFWEGNFMPAGPYGTITPVVREIYVHSLTSIDSVNQVGHSGFFYDIYTQLVAITESNCTGFFEIALPPGSYSFFAKEDSLFYANLFDGEGNILPATVVDDSVTKVQIDIDYMATY